MSKFFHPSIPYANNQPAGSRATNWRGVFWLRKTRKRSAGETNIGWALPAWWRTGSNCAVPEERSDRKSGEFHQHVVRGYWEAMAIYFGPNYCSLCPSEGQVYSLGAITRLKKIKKKST
jgi:hypothetical protein